MRVDQLILLARDDVGLGGFGKKEVASGGL